MTAEELLKSSFIDQQVRRQLNENKHYGKFQGYRGVRNNKNITKSSMEMNVSVEPT